MQYSCGFWIIPLATQLRSEAQCRQHWTPRPSANHFLGTEMSKAWRTLLKNVVQNKQPIGQWYFKFHFPLSISSKILLNLGTNTHLTPMSSGAALRQIVLPCKQPTQLFCFPEHLQSQPTHQQTRQFMQHSAIGMHCAASISTAPTFVIPPQNSGSAILISPDFLIFVSL